MVQLMNTGNLRPESEIPCRNKFPVKLEIEDPLDEEHGPLNKRSKLSPSHQQWNSGSGAFAPLTIPPSQYNPLDEPSPLGLRLRKSPSLLDLIQIRLSHSNNASSVTNANLDVGNKDSKGAAVPGATDKLKASNFPASLLRIGTWENVSRYEGDLVAKCYFAKHKLVWEVLQGGLKSKIEIQWSDIMAIKANCPENGPGTLDIVLSRQPLFFKETNPQPRKHTLWQATSDFTGGQASLHRRHFLQCPQGLLNKHFEKLIQCDPRLNLLSQQPEITLDCPFFETRGSVFKDPDESKCQGFDPLNNEFVAPFPGFRDQASPSASQSSTSKSELLDPVGRVPAPDHASLETPSPSSVMDTRAIEETGSSEAESLKVLNQWEQCKVPGLRPSMSMSDLVSHIGNCLSEQMNSGNHFSSGEGSQGKDMLEEIAQYLLSDSQQTSASDEKSLMSKVNSLCCLLQKDPATVQSLLLNSESGLDVPNEDKDRFPNSTPDAKFEIKAMADLPVIEGESHDVSSGYNQTPSMSRKDSIGDLLLNLPRIASLPQFLFNISEDGEN
ncbi:uncharacterized protein LOC122082770 isoform X2 [Macadamia integrifolia]|uniref:uncharacterized protein LOC122082770 isoform X2 n=1 Tax=Macadamia integrifolia TaxID=60698 RepID=UPI001C4FBFB2|nr:uncharacterized protein LOC122082770 isoform X2 [Macadamia integrifolia]